MRPTAKVIPRHSPTPTRVGTFTMRITQSLVLLALLWGSIALAEAPAASAASAQGARVKLDFFWSKRCPHCLKALPFVESLGREHPWLRIDSQEITGSRENLARYIEMAKALGQEARSVPAFFACGRMLTGFDEPAGMGAEVLAMARACLPGAAVANPMPATAGEEGTTRVHVPLLGAVDAKELSLPVFTLIIASLDAFNPCAFFVLLFLLSLMVHARSRPRMLLVGGTFVLFSGLIYFLFMAAWLNLFLLVGSIPWVTAGAGVLAVLIGVLNTKDYFLFRQGPTLSIPETAKPGLFRRMRGLLAADHLGTMMVGTLALAVAANSYELLCTAGFPMVYTRVLTLHAQEGVGYYGYLILYNVIYVLPLFAIVAAFTLTLGSQKLSERQGRVLKLLSGLMMLGLGVLMLAAPGMLDRLWAGAGVLLGAGAVATVIVALERHLKGARSPKGGS